MRRVILAAALLAFAAPAFAGDDYSRDYRGGYDRPASRFADEERGAPRIAEGLGELADRCRADADRLCYGVPVGQRRIANCLEDQRRDVSASCRLALDVARAAEGCGEDYRRFCPGVPVGRGDVINCLEAYERDLSPSCRRALSLRDDAVVEQGDGRGRTEGEGGYAGKDYDAQVFSERDNGRNEGRIIERHYEHDGGASSRRYDEPGAYEPEVLK